MDRFKKRLDNLFSDNPELIVLSSLFLQQRANAWLVGGCMRDLLLSQQSVDIDIAADQDPTEIAKQWARQCGGRWFWLDVERLQSRVLIKGKVTVDFAPLRAATITGDLNLRDFTVNALACPFDNNPSNQELIDPLNGLEALKQRSLQFCSTRSIAEDPLRMLKGIRHAVSQQMTLSGQAVQLIQDEAPAIKSIAGERIRDELGKILLAPNPVAGFELMHKTGLLPEVFGAAKQSWQSSQAFSELQKLSQGIDNYRPVEADEAVVDEPYNTKSLFLLATFIRLYQPVNLAQLLHERLRLSRQQQRIISSLQSAPDSHWMEHYHKAKSARQKAILVERLGYFPAEQLLYWSISQQVMQKEAVYDLLDNYRQQQQLGRVPDLLDGHQLATFLPPDSKEIGIWQQSIKDAELAGEICDKKHAISWLQNQISN